MKLGGPLEADALATLGADAVGMLCRGNVAALARQYGYALSYGRDVAMAIQDDLRHCLSQVGATSLAPVSADPVRAVRYFKPDAAPLVAVIECLAPTSNGASLLIELVVTIKGDERYITLEQISAVAND
jgi:hypothetical protein